MAQSRPASEESTSTQNPSAGVRAGSAGSRIPGSNFAATTIRSISQLMDMHAASSHIFLGAQFRAAAALGLPDYSRLFQVGDDRALRLFSAMTDNAMEFVRHADSTFHEIQGQMSRQFEQSAINLTERWQLGLEELQRQASESLEELKELSLQQAEEMARATESLTDVTQATLREGGEQFRATVRKGVEHGREIASRQAEAIREEAEGLTSEVKRTARQHRGNGEAGESDSRSNRTS